MSQIEVFTDGGARGNPGPAAIGFLIYKDGKLLFKKGELIGVATNNQAEYAAVEKAWQWLVLNNFSKDNQVKFYLDSQLVVSQLKGIFKIKNIALANIIIKIKNLEITSGLVSSYQQIPRAQNHRADLLVNQALDSLHM